MSRRKKGSENWVDSFRVLVKAIDSEAKITHKELGVELRTWQRWKAGTVVPLVGYACRLVKGLEQRGMLPLVLDTAYAEAIDYLIEQLPLEDKDVADRQQALIDAFKLLLQEASNPALGISLFKIMEREIDADLGAIIELL